MKTPDSNLADDARRLEEAAGWMMRLKAEDADPDEIVRWVRWCEADAGNQEAFDRVQTLWHMSGDLERGSSATASPATAHAGMARRIHARSRWGRHAPDAAKAGAGRMRRAWVACAVAVAGLLWLIGPIVWQRPQDQVRLVSEQRPVSQETLPDGSRVDLAKGSTVQVRYTADVRALELENGEAFFSVERDVRRPFVVRAGGIGVRAVGTAFNVRKAGERVVVTVTEGRVEVFPLRPMAGWEAETVTRLDAGQQLRWDMDASHAAVPVAAPARPERALAWRQGRLEYTNEPLHAVVADLNRYSTSPIVAVGEDVRDLRFSGTVLTAAVSQWLQGLPDIFPVAVQDQNEVTVIQAKPAPASH